MGLRRRRAQAAIVGLLAIRSVSPITMRMRPVGIGSQTVARPAIMQTAPVIFKMRLLRLEPFLPRMRPA